MMEASTPSFPSSLHPTHRPRPSSCWFKDAGAHQYLWTTSHTHTHTSASLCTKAWNCFQLGVKPVPADWGQTKRILRAQWRTFPRWVCTAGQLGTPPPHKKKKKTCSSLTQTLCRPETTAPPPSLLYTSCTDDDDEGGGAPVLPCASSARNNPNNETPRGAVRGAGAEPGEDRRAGPRDSPVGVRGLVDDVLVGGEQGQPVIAEIHSHVSVPASIQPLLMERDSEWDYRRTTAAGGGGGADWWKQREERGVRGVLAPEHQPVSCPMGPSADLSTPAAAQKQLKFKFVRKEEDLCECACHCGKSLLLHYCCYCLTCAVLRSSYSTYKKQGARAKRKYQVKEVNKYETRCESQTCCFSEGLLVNNALLSAVSLSLLIWWTKDNLPLMWIIKFFFYSVLIYSGLSLWHHTGPGEQKKLCEVKLLGLQELLISLCEAFPAGTAPGESDLWCKLFCGRGFYW